MKNCSTIRSKRRWTIFTKFDLSRETLLLASCLMALDVGCIQQTRSPEASQPVVSSDIEPGAVAETDQEFSSSDEGSQKSPATNVNEIARTGAKSAKAEQQNSASAIPQARTDHDAEIAASSDEVSEGDSLPSSPPTKTGSDPQQKSQPDLETVRKNAKSLHKQARSAMSNGDDGKAFRIAAKAWQATQTAPDDANLKALAKEIRMDLETISARANAKFAAKAADPSTLTIEK